MAFNIMIVDDSATTRAIIKRVVQMSGVPLEKLYEAANGKQALEQLAANHIDLVFADLHMPEMSGVELTHAILGNPATREIPVVVVSAEPNASRIEELKREGIKGYLRKPFAPEAIRNLVTELLGVAHG